MLNLKIEFRFECKFELEFNVSVCPYIINECDAYIRFNQIVQYPKIVGEHEQHYHPHMTDDGVLNIKWLHLDQKST